MVAAEKAKKKKKKKDDIEWHPAFVVAIQGILIDYSDALDYKIEHPMPTKSLRIDVLVVKKRRNTVIKKQIAEIFRRENIIEYKSPATSLDISEFHKALARTHVYVALYKNVEITDLTLSFVVTSHPRDLFLHLQKALGYAIEEKHPGIHIVSGAVVPIQIVEIKKLSDEENLWLRNLSRNPPKGSLSRWVAYLEEKYGERIDLSVYTTAILTANQDKLTEEDINMLSPNTRKNLEAAGWGDQWRNEGKLEGKLEAARAMFAEGDSIEKIARVTGISRRTLKAKLAAQ